MDEHIRKLERAAATGDGSAVASLERAKERAGIVEDQIVIGGETFEVNEVQSLGIGDLHEVYTDGGDFIVSEDAEEAGKAARERWADMAEHDQSEFRCIVGDENILQWALGNYAGPGSTQVNSLEDWLDLYLDHPEEEWATYDGEERDIDSVSPDVAEEIGFTPTVAYRHN